MFTRMLLSVTLILILAFAAAAATPVWSRPEAPLFAAETASVPAQIEGRNVRVPFVANQGQKDSAVAFYAETFSGTVFVTSTGQIVYALSEGSTDGVPGSLALVEKILGGNAVEVSGRDHSPTTVNYIRGQDRSKWVSGAKACNSLSFGDVYPGVELQLEAYHNNIEKLFTVQPGANPSVIRMELEGAESLQVTEDGRLEVITSLGSIYFTSPIAYQEIQSRRSPVQVAYTVDGNRYGFVVGEYDRSLPLTIDPLLASTYLGGNNDDCGGSGMSMILDPSGNLYVASTSPSDDYPATAGVYDDSLGGDRDVVISLLSPDLSTVLISTYLGGSGADGNHTRGGPDIALDDEGNLFLASATLSSDFPYTSGVYDSTYAGGTDIFVAVLNGDLTTLIASTFLGSTGYDEVNTIALDGNGHVYLAGCTRDATFPIMPGAFQDTYAGTGGMPWGGDIIVCRLTGDLTTLEASTFLGGSDWDEGTYMALGNDGSVYLSGTTNSSDFPYTSASYDTVNHGGTYGGDCFVSKLDADLSTLLAGTFLGGSENDWIYAIAIDDSGQVFVGGHTPSPDFPTTDGAYDERYNAITGADVGDDGFVSKFNSDLSELLASTFWGSSGWENVNCITFDAEGRVLVGGNTNSYSFPTTDSTWDRSFNGGNFQYGGDAVFGCFDHNLTRLIASSYLGGSGQELVKCAAFDTEGNLFLGGATNSSDFPFTSGAYDTSYNGGETDEWGGDLFLTKIPAEYFVDTDMDGFIDIADICPGKYDPDQTDYDGDTFGDSCDNCIFWFNPLQEDDDADSVGNWCDNCPDTYNPDQADTNGNDVGDVCDGCCLSPTVGDIDQSGVVDITDISVLIDNQFLTLTPLICEAEGEGDFSGVVDITDLSVIIDNQFLTLAPLSPCP